VKPPARAIVGQLVWSRDNTAVWAVWRVEPFPYAHLRAAEQLATHARIRGAVIALPEHSMLLSVCERLDPWDVVADMVEGVDVSARPDWARVCEASAVWLEDRALYRRRFYLAAALGPLAGRADWRANLAAAHHELTAAFGVSPTPPTSREIAARQAQARTLEARLVSHLRLTRATAGELRWLHARALRRAVDDPPFDAGWEPADRPAAGASAVVAPLTDAVLIEGGSRDDEDRPRHRRYVRVDTPAGTGFHAVMALADLPHEWTFPGGGGEWFAHLDDLGVPVDWCVRLRSVSNADAQLKVRRQHRQLIGQVDEYDGEVTGAPPSLGEAIAAVNAERAELAANPAEPELHATILLSVAAGDLPTLEDHAGALASLLEPHDYGVGRPTGGQTSLLRSMLPGAVAAPVCGDYRQYLLPGDLAAGAPFCGAPVGDPTGLLLGVSLDSGAPAPVLLDPAFGPQVGRTASLAAVGALGAGKSFLLKRLCWDTLARGAQVVIVDRTAVGEYARFAERAPGRTQIVTLDAATTVCLDPLRCFDGEARRTVTLGFLSLLAGCSAQSEEGAALADAVYTVSQRPDATLADVLDELARLGEQPSRPDPAARSLARRLAHYQRLGAAQLAFGAGQPLAMDADCIVFWAPHLALPDRDTLLHEHLARQMLPEEILGHALLYLVAAVGREVIFRDPGRFGAALYDEAWALCASPHGQRLLLEGVRDGRKHNGAIWLSTQHPNDLGDGELADLVGARFVFRQTGNAATPACRFIGITDTPDTAAALRSLPSGHCLFRDVRDRVGHIQVLPPLLPELRMAFDTTPTSGPAPASAAEATRRHARTRRRSPLANALERA